MRKRPYSTTTRSVAGASICCVAAVVAVVVQPPDSFLLVMPLLFSVSDDDETISLDCRSTRGHTEPQDSQLLSRDFTLPIPLRTSPLRPASTSMISPSKSHHVVNKRDEMARARSLLGQTKARHAVVANTLPSVPIELRLRRALARIAAVERAYYVVTSERNAAVQKVDSMRRSLLKHDNARHSSDDAASRMEQLVAALRVAEARAFVAETDARVERERANIAVRRADAAAAEAAALRDRLRQAAHLRDVDATNGPAYVAATIAEARYITGDTPMFRLNMARTPMSRAVSPASQDGARTTHDLSLLPREGQIPDSSSAAVAIAARSPRTARASFDCGPASVAEGYMDDHRRPLHALAVSAPRPASCTSVDRITVLPPRISRASIVRLPSNKISRSHETLIGSDDVSGGAQPGIGGVIGARSTRLPDSALQRAHLNCDVAQDQHVDIGRPQVMARPARSVVHTTAHGSVCGIPPEQCDVPQRGDSRGRTSTTSASLMPSTRQEGIQGKERYFGTLKRVQALLQIIPR